MAPEQPRHGSSVSFRPLRPMTPGVRIMVWICGPLLWLVALVIVAEVVRERQAVGIGLAILALSFVVSSVWLLAARRRAVRERREPPPCA